MLTLPISLVLLQPDTGRIEVFRTGEGMGIRLDAGSGFAGAKISPYYDSLLVKVTGRALTHEMAAHKLKRALKEFNVRGVKTNIPFLINVMSDEKFLKGKLNTRYIENNPHLLQIKDSEDLAHKLIYYLAEVNANGMAGVPCAAFVLVLSPVQVQRGGLTRAFFGVGPLSCMDKRSKTWRSISPADSVRPIPRV